MEKAPTPLVPAVAGVLGALLAALIIWASFSADIAESFGAIAADPWGVVALVDLYVGFALFAIIIFAVDGVKPASFVWSLGLCVLGNVLAVVWLILRWRTIRERLLV
ncbi:MAG: hypothetical protein KI785_02240 [Devosiaceae bacterium]|nr:hypothetical protein [Devosiaceae bacterium MH13]